jgi:hypothetical protein
MPMVLSCRSCQFWLVSNSSSEATAHNIPLGCCLTLTCRSEQESPGYDHPFRDSTSILDGFPEWSTRICGASSTGRAGLLRRIDRLLANEHTLGSAPRLGGSSTGAGLLKEVQDDGLVFHGRVDVSMDSMANSLHLDTG